MLVRPITPLGTGTSGKPTGAAAACLVAATAVLLLSGTPGCSDGPGEPHQTGADRAQLDPMNYGPKAEDYARKPGAVDTTNRPGVSDQDGFKRDLDHVFNP